MKTTLELLGISLVLLAGEFLGQAQAPLQRFNITTNLPISHPWAGPTNVWNTTTNDYQYSTFTPFSFTGFVFSSTITEGSSVTVSNAATTNVLGTLPASVHWALSLTNQPTLSNGVQIEIVVKRSTAGYTNGIYQFFP